MTFVVRPRAGQTSRTVLLSQRHEFFMNVCVCGGLGGGGSAASIAISAAARVIVQQWLQCRRVGGGGGHII